ncbi:MAG: hypothetical protein ABJN42_24925 [Roseibium sp.]
MTNADKKKRTADQAKADDRQERPSSVVPDKPEMSPVIERSDYEI